MVMAWLILSIQNLLWHIKQATIGIFIQIKIMENNYVRWEAFIEFQHAFFAAIFTM